MRKLLLLTFCGVLLSNFSNSQGFLKGLKETANKVVAGKPSISTNWKDVSLANTLPASFGEDKTYIELKTLAKTADGCYELAPGFYETTSLSYCLKAGTPRPNKGDAYGLAPVAGPMDEIVLAILTNSQELWRNRGSATGVNKIAGAAISQKDVQLLLWAIIAKADFENMQGKTKATALALLTPQQMVKLYGGAQKIIKNIASNKSGAVRTVEEIENDIRALFLSAATTYEDVERLAVLAGLAPDSNPVEFGTWFLHPGGYYLRFEPQGYPRTTVKFYVPEGKTVCPKITGMVATPSDSRQRLAQTDMSVEEYERSGSH